MPSSSPDARCPINCYVENMTDPSEFIRSIYLGDRACKSILMDGWTAEVRVQVDLISRVRGETWNYYNAENLENGFIVFEGVRRIEWDANGKIPNDAFEKFTVERCVTGESEYIFRMEIASCDEESKFTPVHIAIYADAIALEAQNGGLRIRE